MESFMQLIEKLIAVFMSFFAMFFGTTTPAGYAPLDAANIKLNAAVISDTHIDSSVYDRTSLLRKGLKDINASTAGVDVLAIVGDCTEGGKPDQFRVFFNQLSACDRVKLTLVSLGNHDSWQDTAGFQSFFEHYGKFLRKVVTTTYRHETVKGYHLFTLGTEAKLQDEAYLSQTQLDWFDSELSGLVGTEKPVFVFLHQPFNGTNRVNEAWALGKLGEQSDALMAITKKYTNQGMLIVFFSGHLHSGLGYSGVTNDGNLYFVDCPSFGKDPSRGDVIETGTGYVLEAYIGRIVIRARNFVSGIFYDNYTYTIKTNEQSVPEEPTTGEKPTEPPTAPPETETTTVPMTTLPAEIG